MKWILLFLLTINSGMLKAIPPMPEWIQPDKDKKLIKGYQMSESRTFMIRLEKQKTVVDDKSLAWDYKPSCASFLHCKFAEGKSYDYWSESYVRKSHERLSMLVDHEKKIGIREDVRKTWLLKKR